MCGQVKNVCGQSNFGSNLPSGNFNFRNSYIPDLLIDTGLSGNRMQLEENECLEYNRNNQQLGDVYRE